MKPLAGRVPYLGGSRVLEDVLEKIDHLRCTLSEEHPAQIYLCAARSLPFDAKFR